MPNVQIIEIHDQPIAVVIGGDQTIISESLAGDARIIAERMCLYALDIAVGNRAGPYRNEDALRHAVAGSGS